MTIFEKSRECKMNKMYVQDALEVISGKWKLIILHFLEVKPYRFNELVHEMGITPRMLSKELQELEINRLIKRTVMNSKPITVEYSITEYGKSLNSVTSAIRDWGKTHRKKIMAARDN